MKGFCWTVFLAMVAMTAYANFMHGADATSGLLMAAAPAGFAMVMFILEGIHGRGRGGSVLYVAAGVVAAISFLASYLGLAGMAEQHGVNVVVAHLLPFAFDGVVLVASLGIRAFAEQAPAPGSNVEQAIEQAEQLTEQSLLLEHLEEQLAEQPLLPEQDEEQEEQAPDLGVLPEPEQEQLSEQGLSIAEQVIARYGTVPEQWPTGGVLAEQLACSVSAANKAKSKARSILEQLASSLEHAEQ